MLTPDLSVVIPVFNEAEVLPLLVERLRPVLDGLDATYEVIAVDDGSTDNSGDYAVTLDADLQDPQQRDRRQLG